MLVYNVQYLVHDDDEEDDAIVLQSLGAALLNNGLWTCTAVL